MNEKMGIFTKEHHVEKIVNYLTEYTDIDFIISTNRWEPDAFDSTINISYCFPWLIKNIPKNVVWYNFHPSPLNPSNPAEHFGDWGHWVRALKRIRETGVLMWGASLALIDEGVDSGPELKTIWFPLRSIPVNTQELGDATHYYMFQLFKETIEALQFKPKTKKELEDILNGG
jgi:hypothetical protein